MSADLHEPLFVLWRERRDGSGPAAPPPYRRAKVLELDGGVPVAFAEMALGPDGRPEAGPVRPGQLDRHPVRPGQLDRPVPDRHPGALSVVMPTRNRPHEVGGALEALGRCADDCEIIVVDNASTTSSTREVVVAAARRDARVRLVVEPVPGAARARNRGIAESTGDIVAFTDDDVRVSPDWLQAVRAGFGRDPRVIAVTGLIVPAELETAAQRVFDRRLSWSEDFHRVLYEPDDDRFGPVYPFSPIFGASANLAVLRSSLSRLGGFRETLGPGTPTRAGEDIDLICRLILSGGCLAYEPEAWVWHRHRRSSQEARRQMLGYGISLTAYVSFLMAQPDTRRKLAARLLVGTRSYRRALSEQQEVGRPLAYTLAELGGAVIGPAAAAWSVVRHWGGPAPIAV